MGKNQRGNRPLSAAMSADAPRTITCPPATNGWPWDDVSPPRRKSPSLLDACHNRLHSSEVTIGSPPPKSFSPPPIGDVSDGEAIFRIQVPADDGANNNCPSTATNGFLIGDPGHPQVTQSDCEVDPALSVRIQALKLGEDVSPQLRHPIIVCDEAEEDEGEMEDQALDDASSLSVPVMDVAEEKRRPPLPDSDSF